jgi:hypothetical protein
VTPDQLAVLRTFAAGPRVYFQVPDREWAIAVEFGKVGWLKWPVGSALVEITKDGRAALAAQQTKAE